MAILDADTFARCKQCTCAEFKVEKRGTLNESNNSFVLNGYTAIVCCKCGSIYDTIKKFDGKILIER